MLCRFALLLLAASVDSLAVLRATPLRAAPVLPQRAAAPRAGAAALAQYSGAAAGLFNNMKTPASILAGALIGTGFLSPLPKAKKGEHNAVRTMRKLHLVVAAMSFCSELLSVMWATVAVNKLTETVVAPASSAFALLKRDFELPWIATNAHFVLGMYGFMAMIGLRVFLLSPNLFGAAAAGWAMSGLALMVAIVNRGVASGGGDGSNLGLSVWALIARYAVLLTKQATSLASFGFLELTAIALALASIGATAKAAVNAWGVEEEEEEEE